MIILGISAFYHDSSAAIIIDGKIVAAAQEERFSRIRHDLSFPFQAINFCLNFAQTKVKDLDFVVFYEKPFLKFERLLETYIGFAPKGFGSFKVSMPSWVKDKLFQKKIIKKNLETISLSKFDESKILFTEHHISHAASAFYPSPYKKSAILIMDAVGEWATTSISIGENNKIQMLSEINFPHSIGLLYSAFTYFLGFKVNSAEYKVMGLAPYGRPVFKKKILKNLIEIFDDGSFKINQKYFNYSTGFTMTNNNFNKLFKMDRRNENHSLNQKHMDLAASIQKVIEIIVLKIAKRAFDLTKCDNLCLAGGVALNCVANSKILEEKIFKNIWVQPASGDAGGSIGAALYGYYNNFNKKRVIQKTDSMNGSFLGPKYTNNEIKRTLDKLKIKYEFINTDKIFNKTIKLIIQGKTVGWFQGRMEFGPRALGHRSIIGDPRSKKMQKIMNLKIKFRESFRPFAPSILEEDLKEWFNISCKSPYMLFVAQLNQSKRVNLKSGQKNLKGLRLLYVNRSVIPAVTHVDYTARLQTVNKKYNTEFYKLIKKFKQLTKCPLLINTSFNVRGEPIVCSPKDAIECFMSTNLDALVIENYFILKQEQDKKLKSIYVREFELD